MDDKMSENKTENIPKRLTRKPLKPSEIERCSGGTDLQLMERIKDI
jgi:hypothetical protein